MRIITALIGIFYCGILLAQTPAPNELYKKVANYYQQNPDRIEFVKNIHKNALRYDTNLYTFAYVPLTKNDFFISFIDSTYSFSGGLIYASDYFVLPADMPKKIRLTKRDLDGSMYGWLDHVPAWNGSSVSKLTSWLGSPLSIKTKSEKYILLTKKYIVEIDTLSSRITKIIWIVFDMNKTQYNEYHYLQLSDSIEKSLKQNITDFTNAANNLPTTTFKELEKQKPIREDFEGKSFEFKHLVSLNKGLVDSIINGKYVIFDFFYQACLPCHKMTGYILNWLPKVDTSKIILVGVNPADSEYSMKMEIKNRKINYPVIIGKQAEEIAHRYVQDGYPNLLLVSPNGTILQHHIGMSKSFLTKAEKIISQ